MFGAHIDFFGNQRRRLKSAQDFEKQQKILKVKDKLANQSKDSVKSMFIPKDVLTEKIMDRRIPRYPPLSPSDVGIKAKDNPVDVAINTIIRFDRIERMDPIIWSLENKQRQRVFDRLRQHAALTQDLIDQEEAMAAEEEEESDIDPSEENTTHES